MSNQAIKREDTVFDIEGIKGRLPHRYPFLMIDRIISQSPGECTGIKNVTVNEPYFTGHFPGQSIMPGILIAEAMAQTAAFVGHGDPSGNENIVTKKGFLTSVNVKFHRPVIPGDRIIIRVKRIKAIGPLTKFTGEAVVDGVTVAFGEFNIAEVQ